VFSLRLRWTHTFFVILISFDFTKIQNLIRSHHPRGIPGTRVVKYRAVRDTRRRRRRRRLRTPSFLLREMKRKIQVKIP
jgi:hypothetical protein